MDMLKADLQRLGFTSIDKILQSAVKRPEASFKGGQILEMEEIDKRDQAIEYKIIAQRAQPSHAWRISSISGYVSMHDWINQEPGPRIYKSYSKIDGFLPDKHRIRLDLAQAVGENTVNKLLAGYGNLEAEFKRYGFEKNRNRITYCMGVGAMVYFKAQEKVTLPQGNGTEKVDFMVGVLFDEERRKAQILEVAAFLSQRFEVDRKLDRKTLDHIKVHLKHGELPDKNQIITLLRSGLGKPIPFQWGKPPWPILSAHEALKRDCPKEIKEGFYLELPHRNGYKHRM